MLPSEVPRLTTDLPVRMFPGVWKPLFFKTPFLGWISDPPSFVSLFIFYIFFLPPFEDNGPPFWVPDVLCQHSEVVLWNLLNVQMFFGWICGVESGLPVLLLHHLRTTPSNYFSGSLPISSSFIWTCVFLVCSFICVVFLCFFIIIFLNILCLRAPFPRLQGWILSSFSFLLS